MYTRARDQHPDATLNGTASCWATSSPRVSVCTLCCCTLAPPTRLLAAVVRGDMDAAARLDGKVRGSAPPRIKRYSGEAKAQEAPELRERLSGEATRGRARPSCTASATAECAHGCGEKSLPSRGVACAC